MGFTKLDEGILQSSVMATDPVTFKVWIALLAACESDGIARVAPPFLSAVCHLPIGTVRRALEELAGPDPDSRTMTADGRRIERVDGGWRLINYLKYRRMGLKEAESEARSERRHREREGEPVRTVSGQSPDPSASASASASGGEKGSGGEGSQDSPPRQPFPGERAEQAIKDQTRSLQLKLGALIGRLAEHPRSTRMVPDWSREVTSYERPDGTKVRGSPDWRTIFSIDRLEKSIADAEWWFNKLEAEEVPAHGTR